MQPVRDWLIVGGIFTAALVVGGALVLRPMGIGRGPAVTNVKATRLMTMPTSIADVGMGSSAYQWLDSKTVLIHDRIEDYTVDVATGARSTPSWITQAQKKFGGKKTSTGFYGWVLSPDRKWAVASVSLMTDQSPAKLPMMLAGRMDPGGGTPSTHGVPAFPAQGGRWLLARVDGTAIVDIGAAKDLLDIPVWHPDSKGWFEVDQSSAEASTVSEWTISGGKVTRKTVESVAQMSPMTVIGAVSNKSVLTMAGGDEDDGEDDSDSEQTMPYNVIHFEKGKEVVDTTYKYPFGLVSIPLGHELSPDATRIAWDNASARGGLGGMLLQSAVMHKSPYNMELKVGNLDGSRMRVLVTEPMEGQYAGPISIRWMPDGKHVSYVDMGGLWSVPVD